MRERINKNNSFEFHSRCCFPFLTALFIVASILFSPTYSFAQFGTPCDATTPSFTVDLTGQPSGTWTSPAVVRDGNCCGATKKNIVCIEFWLTLDPNAQGIKFSVPTGALPSNLDYQINCGTTYNVDEQICLSGVGPHRITFCKPGGNTNTYAITSIAKPSANASVYVSDGCTSTIKTSNFQTNTITWQSIAPGAPGQYNGYLSFPVDKSQAVATYVAGAPSSVTYQICGVPTGGCSGANTCVTTTVNFVSTLAVTISPNNPTICFGGTSTPLTANVTGGAPPYQYTWTLNGATVGTTQTINATQAGTYIVNIKDGTSCPQASSSVVVTMYTSPITADAGPDVSSCGNNPNATLTGSVQQATGGKWTGGAGTYSPSNTSLNATYTPTAAEIAAGTVTHTLTTTGNGTCPASTDQAVMTIAKTPIVNAGPDVTVCSNNAGVTLNGSVTNVPGGIWSGGGGTFFPNNTTLNAIYTPTAAEISTGTVTLTLTSTGNGNCIAVTDQIKITINQAPVVNAGTDKAVCANNPAASIAGTVTGTTTYTWSGGVGTYSPSATNNLNITYTPTAGEITTGSVTLTLTATKALCNPVTDDMVLTITTSPTADAGPDRTVCGNNANVTLNGLVTVATGGTWTGGAGTFSPNANTLTATYTPTTTEINSGNVTLTLTTTGNGSCNAVTDQVKLFYTPAPTVNAGADQTVCGNKATVSLNGSVTVASGGTWSGGTGVFSPNANTLNATYAPSAAEILAGTVTLTLTSTGNGLCNPVTDQMVITITAAPTANANVDQSICSNKTATTLNGIVTVATGGTWSGGAGTFSPNANTLGAVYTPTATEVNSGSVTLTLTTTGNGSCNAVTDQMTISFTPAPTANAGLDQTVCANNAAVTLNGSVTIALGGSWSGGAGTFTPNNTTLNATYKPTTTEINSGSVTLTLTTTGNGTCNAVTDQMKITITAPPIANAGSDQTVCANNPNVTLNGSVTVATGGTWSNGTGTFVPNSNTLNASYIPSASEISMGIAALVLTTTGNGNCIAVRDTVLIFVTNSPTANAGADKTVCGNNPTVAINGAVSNASSFVWSGGAGVISPNTTTLGITYTPSAAEITSGSVTLTLTASRASCLAVSDQVVINITPAPTVDAGADQTVCANNSTVTLAGAITVATGATWSGGAGTFTPNNTTLNATYTPTATEISTGSVNLTLTTTGNGNCLAVNDQMKIIITPAPTVNANADQTVCGNKSTVTLAGAVTVATGGTWSGGTGTFSPNANTLNAFYTPSAAEVTTGTVNLTLTTTGNGNCNAVTDQMKITITPAPTVNAGPDLSICANNAIAQLNGAITVAGGAIWTGGNGIFNPDNTTLNAKYSPTASEITAGTVTLTLTSTSNGNCNQVSDDVIITITTAPTVNAGADQTVCGNASAIPLNGVVTVATGGKWVTSGTGSFTPNNTTLNASYVPTAADTTAKTITLTLTTTGNGTCNAVTDQLDVKFSSVPYANAGPDQTVCTNDLPIKLNGTGTAGSWVGGSGTFTPGRAVLNPTYTPTAAETTTGSVNLNWTTNAIGACASVTDAITITIPQGPVVNAGPDQTVCGDVNSIPLAGTASNVGGVLWGTNGTGTFSPNATTLAASYVPSAADKTNGTVKISLISTSNGACTGVSDSMVITITPAPTVNAGPDQTFCADISTISLGGSKTVATGAVWSGGAGTFTPDNTTLITTYKPTVAEKTSGTLKLTLTTTGNGTCNAVSDDIIFTFTPAPTVNAGVDQTICADKSDTPLTGTVTVATGGAWTTLGSGTFSPDNATLNTSYNPSTADTTAHSVKLVLTTTGNGTCIPVSDTMVLTILPQPVVNAGPDQTYCSDITGAPLTGTIYHATGGMWTTSGTGSFSPDNTTLNASYVPSATDKTGGVVTLTLTSTGNGLCNSVSDQVVLNFTPAPTIDAGPDLAVCAGSPTVALNATVTVASGGTWSTSGSGTFTDNNILNPSYTASLADTAAHSIMLRITSTGNGTCKPVTDSLKLTIQPVPIVDPGANVTVCGDVTTIPLNGIVYNATGGTWSGGAGSFTPNTATLNASYVPTAAEQLGTTVTLTLTSSGNGVCSSVSNTMNITITPAPTVIAGGDQTICADAGSVSLNGTITVATGGTWTTSGTGTFADANSLTTTYTPSATDIINGTVVLTLTTTGNGTCNPVKDKLTLTITPAPTVDAGPDKNVCGNQASIVLNGNVTTATGGVWTTTGTGSFSPDANTINAGYIPSSADTAAHSVKLYLTTTGNGTCKTYVDSMSISFQAVPIVDAGPDVTICADASTISLSAAAVTNATGGSWTSTGSGTFTASSFIINPSYAPSAGDKATGNLTLTLTSTGNGICAAVSDQLIVTITPAPTVDAGPDVTVCATTTGVQLNGLVTIASGGVWSTGSGTGTFSPDSTVLNALFTPSALQIAQGKATIRLITTGNGTCKPVSDIVVITINPAPVVNPGANQTVCASVSSVSLTGTVTNATGGTWATSGTGTFANTNALATTYTPSAADKIAGNITLTLTTTGNGPCTAVSKNVTIGFQAVPTADAGPATLCTNMSGVTLGGSVTNASGGKWTSTGTGTFTPSPNILAPKYTPSAADQAAGTIKLYFTATGTGPCASPKDSLTLGIQLDPVANAGPDQIVCADIGTVALSGSVSNTTGGVWSSSGGGAFTPNSTTLNGSYTPSAVDISNGSVTLTLTTNPNGFCSPISDQMVITITPAPTINAGPDQTICADASGVTLNGTVSVATGGKWTSSGTGTFNPSATALNATYVPSAADTAAHSVTLTLTTTGNGTCKAITDQMVITITPAPTINLGPDQTICGDVSLYAATAYTTVATGTSWQTTGTGTITTVDPFTIHYAITPGDVTAGNVKLIAGTTGNGTCLSKSDTLVLTITPAPTVKAGAGNACADADTIQLSGTITVASGAGWTTTGSGSFVPDSSTLNAKYVPSATDKTSGLVKLYLITTGNGTCNAVQDSVTLNIQPSPIVDAGPDQNVCGDIGALSLAGSITNAGGGVWSTLGSGTFTPDNTTLNGSYNLSVADTAARKVTLVLTSTGNGSCSAVTDTMKVTIAPAPIVDAGPSVICQSAGSVNLNGIIYNATGGLWTTGGDGVFGDVNNLSTTYTPGAGDIATGSAVIKLNAVGIGTCKPTFDIITINIQTAPTSNAGADNSLCADVTSIPLSGTITNAGGGIWSTTNGNGTFVNPTTYTNASYNVTTADTTRGFVTFVLTTTGNGICLPVTDTMVVTLTDAPTINPGPANVCSNAPPVALNGQVTVATGGVWTTSGDGTFGNANALATSYTPGATDNSSGTVVLTLTTTGMGTCNAVSGTITLHITDAPSASADIDQTICADSSKVFLNGAVSGATGGLWTSSGTGSFVPEAATLNATYVPSTADTSSHSVTLTLTTTGVGACNPVNDALVVTIKPTPIVNAGTDQTVCGDIVTINLNGMVANATGGKWATPDGAGSFGNANNLATTYTPTSADTSAGKVTFVLSSTGMGTCNVVTDTMIVTITDAPSINANPTQLCSDAISIPISVVKTVATGVQWTTTGDGNFAPNDVSLNTFYVPSANDRLAGFVQLSVTTTGNGTCNAVSDNIQIFLKPAPTASAGGDQGICADAGTVSLTGSVANAGGGIWSTMGSGTFANDNSLNTTYNLSQADTASHQVKLILTTSGVAPCTPATDTVVIDITPAPVAVVNAGTDTTVCADNPDVPLNGHIYNAAGGMWTSTGSGIFTPNSFTLDATYMPSGADVALGTVSLMLESTGNGICNPIRDTMVVTITSRPTADPGPNDTICADAASVPLNVVITTATQVSWFTSGSGSFVPNANVLNPSYVPSASDTSDKSVILTVQTIDNGACSAAIANKQITITPAPKIDAGFDQIACGDADSVQVNGSVIIATGGTWTSSGTGTFSDPNILNPYYRFSPADTASGAITLTFTSTGNGLCNPVSDNVTITITDAPQISAGPDQTICADQPQINLSGFVTVANGMQWTSSGTGYYSPDDVSPITSYYTSDADTAARALTFVLASTSAGSCHPVVDTMKVTINPLPIVQAGPDQTVCADIGNVTLNGSVVNASGGTWATSGTGTFPDANILNAFYVPSAVDTTNGLVILNLQSTGNGFCNPVTDFLKIIITPAPYAKAGPAQTVCADVDTISVKGYVAIASGGQWSSSGTGTFLPDAFTLNAKYIPSAADRTKPFIYLRITTTGNGTCNPVTDSLKVTITPAPTVNPGTNQSMCADASSISITGAVTVASGGVWKTSGTGTFAPNPNSLTISYMPSAADKAQGLIGLTLTTTGNGTCKAVSKNITLAITPAPTVNAGKDISICKDATTIQLAGSKTVASGVSWTSSGSGSFSNSSSLNPTYSPSASDKSAGVVNIKITTTGNGKCQAVIDNMVLTLTPAPTVHAGPDMIICGNSGFLKVNGTVTIATGGTWSTTGSGVFVPAANKLATIYVPSDGDTTAKVVQLVLTTTGNGTCQPKKDTMVVKIDPVPIVGTGGTRICSDLTGVNLQGSVANATGATWSTTGSGTFSPSPATLNARYTPSAADITAGYVVLSLTSQGNGTCEPVTETMDVTVTPLPVADAGTDQRICRGASTTLIGRTVPDVSYDWYTTTGVNISNSGIVKVTANSDTSFVLGVTDAKGCSVYDTVTVFVVDPPTFNMASNYCFYFGNALSSNPVPIPANGTFQWYRNDSILLGENNYTVNIKGLGEHVVEYNYGSCTVSDTTFVTPLPVVNGLDKFACINAPTIIHTNNIANATYSWTRNGVALAINNDSLSVNASATPFDTTTYIATVTNKLGCPNNDTLLVVAIPPPNITITDMATCNGQPILLNAQPSNISPLIYGQVSHYAWGKDGVALTDTTSAIQVAINGKYNTIFHIGECYAYDTSNVVINPLPTPNHPGEFKYCNETEDVVTLDAGPGFFYRWMNTTNPTLDTNQTVVVGDPGYYYVKIINQYGCSVIDKILATDACPPRFFVPESFTPDDPFKNNRFEVFGAYFKNFEIYIYNRWGEIIFHSTDRNDAWDGTYRGEKMPPGVYPYVITYDSEFEDFKGKQLEGRVVLIR